MPEEKEAKIEPEYSDSMQDLISEVRERWSDSYEAKHQSYHHLNDRSLLSFWADCRDAVDAYTEPQGELEEWQSTSYRPKTRNKTFSVAASLAASGVGIDPFARRADSSVDREMSQVCDDVYEASLELENFDFKLAIAIFEQAVTGTVHLVDEVVWDEREVKEISDIDLETGIVTYVDGNIVDFKGCRAEVVPGEEIFPGDNWEPVVQKQPYYFRRKIVDYEVAEGLFGKKPNWKYVSEGSSNFMPIDPDVKELESDGNDENVEILWYWDKPKDRYNVFVNGIPMENEGVGFPYPHKKYPIAKGRHLPFADQRFYWGNSVPNLNRDEQKDTNDLWRMMIDGEKLRSKPPIGTSNEEIANSDIAIPGTTYPLGPDDRVEVMEAFARGPANSTFSLLQLNEGQIDENTIDPLVAGKSPQGNPTATEVRTIAVQAERLKGFAETMLGDLLIQHAEIRIPNALWFLTHDEDYKRIVREDINLGSKNGRKFIQFVDADEIPSAEDIMTAEVKLDKMNKPTKIVYVDRDGVNDYRYAVGLAIVPKPRRTGAMRILRALEKHRVYASDPMFNRKKSARDLAEAFGDNPDEVIAEQQPQQPQGAPAQLPPNEALSKALGQTPIA
jgi:hypothetical protein